RGKTDDLDVAAGAGSVHHLAVTCIEAVVTLTGEEHDVSGLQCAHVVDLGTQTGLGVGGAGQVDACLPPGRLDQTGAVVAVGTGTAVDVRQAHLGVAAVQRRTGVATGPTGVLSAAVVGTIGGSVGVAELGKERLLLLDLLLALV